MAIKTTVNKDVCISCGTCIALAPKSFQWDADNKAESINPPGDDAAAVKDAAGACPVQAITVEE